MQARRRLQEEFVVAIEATVRLCTNPQSIDDLQERSLSDRCRANRAELAQPTYAKCAPSQVAIQLDMRLCGACLRAPID